MKPALIVKQIDIQVVSRGEQGPPGPPGNGGGVTTETISVWNDGDPQIVFTKTGDVVTNAT